MKTKSYEAVSKAIPTDELNIIVKSSLKVEELELISTFLILREFFFSIKDKDRDAEFMRYKSKNGKTDDVLTLNDFNKFNYPVFHFPYPMLNDYLQPSSDKHLSIIEAENKVNFPNLKGMAGYFFLVVSNSRVNVR